MTRRPLHRSRDQLTVLLLLAGVVCLGLALPSRTAKARASQDPSILARYDLSKNAGDPERLPRVLEEVSGLATTPDGRLFAHQDERGVIYQLDPASGDVVKAFSAGIGGTPGDFEGLAYAEGRFFLMTSGGELVEVAEGDPGTSLRYRVHPTSLGRRCELEGLAFDPQTRSFLIPCKQPRDADLEDHLVVFELPLETMEPATVPRIFLPLDDLETVDLEDKFHASAIEIDPRTGSILVAAAREEALLEFTRQGRLVAGREVKRSDHPQPEGLAFLLDGTLVIADEGQGNRGRITRYPPIDGEKGQGS